ncbi:hypothetical protein KADA111694_11630 [Kaistella daneshvariae]
MIINNTKHINLIQDELIYQTNEFEKLLKINFTYAGTKVLMKQEEILL